MRKHFLILMLLALLPLTVGATLIKVTPYNVSKFYGQADADIALVYDLQDTDEKWDDANAHYTGTYAEVTHANDAEILEAGLYISRNGSANAGEDPNDYTYTLMFSKNRAKQQFAEELVDAFVSAYSVGILGNATLSIHEMPMDGVDSDVEVAAITPKVYTGSAITPALTVTNNGKALVLNTDYTVEYTQNTDPSDVTDPTTYAVATLTGIGKYTGTKAVNFVINANMADAEVTLTNVTNPIPTYDGASHVPGITVKMGTKTLTLNTDYTVEYINSNTDDQDPTINAGTITVKVIGVDAKGYSGSNTSKSYVINPAAIAADKISYTLAAVAPQYTGEVVKPVFAEDGVTVKVGDADPIPVTTYTIAATGINATAENAATATLTLTGNYSGTKTVNYTIAQKNIDGEDLLATLDQTTATNTPNNYTWTNDIIQPTVTLTKAGATIAANQYDVTYANADDEYTTAVGAKKAVISPKTVAQGANYTFTEFNAEYAIVKKALTITVNDVEAPVATDINPTLKFEGLVASDETTQAAINAAADFQFYTTGDLSALVLDIDNAVPETYTIKVIETGSEDEDTHIGSADGLRNLGLGANYEITFVDGKLTKTAGQVLVKISNNKIEWGQSFVDAPAWKVSYVSGLAADQVEGFMDGLVIDQGQFHLVTPYEGIFDVNTNGYDVTYGTGTIANDYYTVTVQTGKLVVNKKNITADMIQIADGGKYTAAAKSPKVTIPYEVKNADNTVSEYWENIPEEFYTVTYDTDFNAGEHKAQIADVEANPYFTAETPIPFTAEEIEAAEEGDAAWGKTVEDIKEILPYAEGTYTIHPLQITITPKAATWKYGTTELPYEAEVTNTTDDDDKAVEPAIINALLAGQQPEGFNGTLVINRVGADNVGTYNQGLQASIVDAEGTALNGLDGSAADNYEITFVKGTLTITKGLIKVKVSDATLAYKVDPDNNDLTKKYTFKLEPTSDMGSEAADFENIVTYSHDPADYGYKAEWKSTIGNYPLEYEGADPTATNYDIEWDDTVDDPYLHVVARPIKIRVKAGLATTYTELLAENGWIDDLEEVNTTTKEFGAYVELVDEEGFYGFVEGTEETFKDVIASVNLESENVGENALTITEITTGDVVAHYAITVVPGILTVTADDGVATFTLNRVLPADYADEYKNTAARIIEQQAGKFVNINFSDFNMIAEKWYPLVLPFATSVREISKVFGYAVVDVFNGTTADGKIQFKLHMGDIEANTPFIVKVYENQNMSDVSKYYEEAYGGAKVKFANVKLVNDMDVNKEVTVNAGSEVDFVGTYKGRIDGFDSKMYYFSEDAKYGQYYKGNDTNKTYLRPLGAYLVDNAANAANTAREILIQEADGSTTAISAVTVDGAFVEADGWFTTGGVKLQGVPTEKGVYIRNGKKIVIK